MTFDGYVNIIENMLARHWGITDAQVTSDVFGPGHGIVSGTIVLLDGSYIDFSEEIFIEDSSVGKRRYRYQYVKNQQAFFRYDNYPNHPGLRPPFHHKHVPKRRLAHLKEAPKIIDVLEEALRYMF